MSMDDLQKSNQTADDLDEQATRLNIYISDPSIAKQDRESATQRQLELRQHAADLRVEAILLTVGGGALSTDQIIAAADKAKAVANKINEIKKSLDLAAATIAFFAALSSKDIGKILSTWDTFKPLIDTNN